MRLLVLCLCLMASTQVRAEIFYGVQPRIFDTVFGTPLDARTQALGGGVAAAEGPSAAWSNPAAPTAPHGFAAEWTSAEQVLQDTEQWVGAASARVGPVELALLHSRWDAEFPVRTAYLPEGNGESDEYVAGMWQAALSTDLGRFFDPDGRRGLVLRVGAALRDYRWEYHDDDDPDDDNDFDDFDARDLDLGFLVGMGRGADREAGDLSWRVGFARTNVTNDVVKEDPYGWSLIGRRSLGGLLDYCLARRADGGPLIDVRVHAQSVRRFRDGLDDESRESLGFEVLLGGVAAVRLGEGDDVTSFGVGLQLNAPGGAWGLRADYAATEMTSSSGSDTDLDRWTLGARYAF